MRFAHAIHQLLTASKNKGMDSVLSICLSGINHDFWSYTDVSYLECTFKHLTG